MCETVSIMGYCICGIAVEWFVCIGVLKVCVDFGEVVSCIHDSNVVTFTTWLDYNGVVISEVVQFILFLHCWVTVSFRHGLLMEPNPCSTEKKDMRLSSLISLESEWLFVNTITKKVMF